MEIGVIFATLLLLVVLFFILRLIMGPLKIITKFFINCVFAVVAIVIFNLAGGYLGFHMALNPVSVMGISVLGIPGFLLFAFLSYLFI